MGARRGPRRTAVRVPRSRFVTGTRGVVSGTADQRSEGTVALHVGQIHWCTAKLREDYEEHPDPAGFAGDCFTLRVLQRVHEAVKDEPIMRDTFRRVMKLQLIETGKQDSGSVGKPAALFRKRARTGDGGKASRAIGGRSAVARQGSRTKRK